MGLDAEARDLARPWWAVLTVWAVVNSVNLLQTVGFLSRTSTGTREINHGLGVAILLLAVPAGVALVAFVHAGTSWLHRIGPASFIVFCLFAFVVDYARPVEFRDPTRLVILVPYLVLFFGSILLMGLPLFFIDRRRWLLTAATAVLLVASMGIALRSGVA